MKRAEKPALQSGRPICREALRVVVVVLGVNSAFGPIFASAQPALARGGTNDLPVLTNVQQVLDLGMYQARRLHQPVRLRGVALSTLRDPPKLILHDGMASIMVEGTNAPAGFAVGKLVEADGITESGLAAPYVMRAALRVVGEAPIPEPLRLPVARMMAGEGCWQFVRIEGVVRDMNLLAPHLALSIAAEGRRFTARIYHFSSRFQRIGLPLEWLEARVTLDGVCYTEVNDRNQPTAFNLVVHHTNQVHLLSAGTTNIFALPTLRSNEAARLHHATDTRLKLVGTVVAQMPGDRLFLRTEFGPVQARRDPHISHGMPYTLLVEREPVAPPEPGDRIELVGAPTESTFAPLLLDAEFRLLERGAAPAPTPVSAAALASGQHDADLVRLTARLVARERRAGENGVDEILVLEAGDSLFEAAWRTDATNTLPSWPINARLEADGICVVQAGPANLRRAFRILLRGPADIRYRGQTPLWLRPGAGRASSIAAALIAVAAVWVWLLRRQVHERTAALATANARMSGEIEERKRAQAELDRALAAERELGELKGRFVSLVSHEFRTPLGITMSAVELLRNYLDRLPPAKLKELLDDIYSSTLRMSGLMEQVLLLGRVEAGKLGLTFAPLDVAAFGNKLVDETLSATNRKCPVQFHAADDLGGASADEALLRHIFSNLLSNAVKYSPNGSPVAFDVQRAGTDAVFTVRDRGLGIPEADQAHLFEAFHRAANVSQVPGTGLGLLIVKRCVELHGGTVAFASRVGAGTTFTVRVPLFFNS